MQLHGLHHVTAVTARIGRNANFYTNLLGLRLVKKTVNQDDVQAYHLFYADKVGSPGTDMTFFDWPMVSADLRGTDSISGTAFRVNGEDALRYWIERFDQAGVTHHGSQDFAGRPVVRFEDPDGQRLILVDDQGADFEGEVWDETDVPPAMALRGFYAARLTVPSLDEVHPILSDLLNFSKSEEADYPGSGRTAIYTMDGGGPGRELWVTENKGPWARTGAGGVHHIAFRVRDHEQQKAWLHRIAASRLPVSNFIDRFYFQSIYFRVTNGILFEIATDGPGFTADEDLETLGQKLALPPFLEDRREQIEAGLKPIVMETAV